MYKLFLLKRRLEALAIFPFALLGRLIARLRPLEGEFGLFLFFPFYHVGGAERVHAQIAQLFPDKKIIIFFTKKSQGDALLPQFKAPNITVRDISRYTDNKFMYWNNLIWRGIAAEYIRRQRVRPVVFNGQCNFAYKLSPHVPKSVRQVELIHSFCSFSYIRIPFIPFYETTVMISRDSIRKHLELYRKFGVPAASGERIRLIMNGIPIPADVEPLPEAARLLYAGRGTSEKRPWLVAAIAQAAGERAGMLGPLETAIPAGLQGSCVFYGEQSDAEVIDRIYREHRIIAITSSTEGFPMVIMEAMARGLAVLSTDVGDIPYHVQHGVNGWLLSHRQPEAEIVAEGARLLREAGPDALAAMRERNIAYAKEHFSLEAFAAAYRSLLSN
ncbi:glycosyltransferase family 4 protein [Chitinophaga rhizosphaerae]|uniref:glycosyltransferase family 4 protein n=1 Tax=Chitinophaga rhizosphaerae TaxID=1864947 RepID=UPI0013DFCC1D|nr:glycosyltransferase family 4 protein [Chitinophaga rhizosphaerae]